MTITVPLARPLTNGETTYTELTFREAELGDMIAADAITGETGKTTAVLASMCGVPYAAFKKLTMADMNTVLGRVGHLLGNAPAPAATGG